MATAPIQSLQVDSAISSLTVRHPDPATLKAVISEASSREREIVVRLWLAEGEPYAFRNCPGIFEDMRGWLASRLKLHPKDFTLAGSARTGFSLSPEPKHGTPFSNASDLDLTVVSESLFQQISKEFYEFQCDYEEKRVTPRSGFESRCWEANLEFGSSNLPKGFFDAGKLPNFQRYSMSQAIAQSMWALCKKLEMTPNEPQPHRASLRIYRDWNALVNRVSLNLKWAICQCCQAQPFLQADLPSAGRLSQTLKKPRLYHGAESGAMLKANS